MAEALIDGDCKWGLEAQAEIDALPKGTLVSKSNCKTAEDSLYFVGLHLNRDWELARSRQRMRIKAFVVRFGCDACSPLGTPFSGRLFKGEEGDLIPMWKPV
jgi:hypothetical protein